MVKPIRTLPLVVYRDSERVNIGEATLQNDGTVRLTVTDEDVRKVLETASMFIPRGNFSFIGSPRDFVVLCDYEDDQIHIEMVKFKDRVPFDAPYYAEDIPRLDRLHTHYGLKREWKTSDRRYEILQNK